MSAAIAEKTIHPIVALEQQLEGRLPEFAKALPAHIPPERFKRVVLTAVQNNPGLVKVERRSFFNSCMKAAQDGLLPDGREGAIVEYNDRQRGPIAQWMPMVAGLRKKVRNSGEIADWNAHVVFEKDEFDFQLGDEPFIRHKPALDNRGRAIAAYSIARFKTGELSREVMSIGEIEKVRAVSRAKDSERGPWKQWFEEMARKTVARRHAKQLPMSSDLDDLIRRDDELYDMPGAREASREEARRPTIAGMLDHIAGSPPAPAGEPEDGAGPIVEGEAAVLDDPSVGSEPGGDAPADSAGPDLENRLTTARERGGADAKAGEERRVPAEYGRSRRPEAQAFLEGFDAAVAERESEEPVG